MPAPRRLLAATAALGLLAGTGVAVHATLTAETTTPATTPAATGDAQRFLHLTGGDQAVEVGSDTDDAAAPAQAAAAPAAGERGSCATSPATVGTLPNGWCLRPAGRSVDVLRFPLGAVPTTNGKVVVTSNSGGV